MKVILATPMSLLLLLGACSQSQNATESGSVGAAGASTSGAEQAPLRLTVDPGAEQPEPVQKAVAVLHPTAGSNVHGTIRFDESDGTVQVRADVRGLPPGAHAYHVHLLGDCSGPDGKTAGTHFHFDGSSKNPPADIQHITGDLGELMPGEDGTATTTSSLDNASLQGAYSIIGRSVVVHEKGNDPSQPPIGAAGGRIACGVIGITESQ